jgi:class 3 adenylate cyclase
MPEERRLVTVLFADVVGSTSLGEELDPEDLRALLARYYSIARDVIGARGGTLEKFIGDAVMAIFGLPTAHDDDPRRALDAALELRDRVRDEPGLGERLPIRVGVNTGEVVASREPAAGDFIVTGDAVNVGARPGPSLRGRFSAALPHRDRARRWSGGTRISPSWSLSLAGHSARSAPSW